MRSTFIRSAAILLLSTTALAAQDFDVSRIDRRVTDWQPTRAERRFDDIGWAPDLCTALKAGKDRKQAILAAYWQQPAKAIARMP